MQDLMTIPKRTGRAMVTPNEVKSLKNGGQPKVRTWGTVRPESPRKHPYCILWSGGIWAHMKKSVFHAKGKAQ